MSGEWRKATLKTMSPDTNLFMVGVRALLCIIYREVNCSVSRLSNSKSYRSPTTIPVAWFNPSRSTPAWTLSSPSKTWRQRPQQGRSCPRYWEQLPRARYIYGSQLTGSWYTLLRNGSTEQIDARAYRIQGQRKLPVRLTRAAAATTIALLTGLLPCL